MMFDWKKQFNSIILKRGLKYYKSGMVQSVYIDRSSSAFCASVKGQDGKKYAVSLPAAVVANNSPFDIHYEMECNCEYAKDGNLCKHMVAMLYKLEELNMINNEDSDETSLSDNSLPNSIQSIEKKTLNNSNTTSKTDRSKNFNPFINDSQQLNRSDSTDKKLMGYKEEYSFFDLGYITRDLAFTKANYEKAQKLIDDDKISGFTIHRYNTNSGFDGLTFRISAKMQDSTYYSNWYENVTIDITRDAVTYVYCSLYSCHVVSQTSLEAKRNKKSKDSLCPHALALLIAFRNYMRVSGRFTDLTSDSGFRLIKKFSPNLAMNDEPEEEITEVSVVKNVNLEPVVVMDASKIFLEFKLGKSKMYKLKSIEELVDCYNKKEILKLGKNNEIDFQAEDFTPESAELFDYIMSIYNEDQEKQSFLKTNNRTFSYYPSAMLSELSKNFIPLFGSKLDMFFDIYDGRSVPFVNAEYYRRNEPDIFLSENVVKVTIYGKKIVDENGVFQGIKLESDNLRFFNGSKFSYYYDTGHLYRITRENSDAISAFSDNSNNGSIIIGRNSLADFYYDVLPQIEEYVEYIEDDSKTIQEYLPPRPDFTFYLDTDTKNVYCKVRVQYDDDKYFIDFNPDMTLKISGYRNRKYENEIASVVGDFFPTFYGDIKSFGFEKNNDSLYEFLSGGVKKLMMYGEVQSTPAFDSLKLKKKWNMSVGVSVQNDLMNLSIISDDISVEELSDILKSYKKKKKYHRLKNGDFISMEDSNILAISEMLDALQLSPKDFIKKKGNVNVPLYRALYLDKMLEEHEEISSERDRNFKNLVRSFKTTKDADYELPPNLENILRKYQKNGFRWLMTMDTYGFGGILADEMGLGKTLQVISMLQARKISGAEGTSLVICPSSLVYNWREEFIKFAPDMKACCVVGNKSEREDIIRNAFSDYYDVLITSYDLLKRDIDLYADASFDYEIVDEAQYIKNHNTMATKSVKVINSKHRIALTGTPIENRLSELWSIFDYLMPGYLYSYEKFRTDYESVIVSRADDETSQQLRRMVSPFIMRRLKKDVLKDLPEKIEETRIAVFENEQKKLYDAQVLKLKNMLEDASDADMKKQKIQVLAELTRLRQICCDPSLIFEDYKSGSAKLQALMDLLSNAIEGGHRSLVFSQFTSMFDIIEPVLKKEGIEYYKITGQTSKEERARLVKAFNEDETPVFLISLKAGGTGLNLTGADTVVHYDPWWNVAVQNQATDRAHRIGQTKIVTVYKLIAKGTIEEKIVKLQETKKELAEEILSGETGNLANMTREELMDLLDS